MNNGTFTYRFDLDRDYFIDFSMRYQSILPFVSLATIRPLIFVILMRKRDYMAADIRWGYIINQFAIMLQEFNFCFLFRIHDLAPYAGLYCDGPICRMGIGKQYLMAILASTTIGTVPTFLCLLFRMHQLIIANTNSKLKLSNRSLSCTVSLITVLLMSNVVGFYLFGRDCTNPDEMEKIPDLAWLKARGGTLFLFGPPGQAEFLNEELMLLACSLTLIAPFIGCATLHSIIVMHRQKQVLSSTTQGYQARLTGVFFIQLIVVNIFYILPLSGLHLHMTVDVSSIFPTWIIALGRWTLIILFTLEGTQLSLIFLLKNPVHRQIIQRFFQTSTVKPTASQVTVLDRTRTVRIVK